MTQDKRGYIYTYPQANLETLQQLLRAGSRWAYVAQLATADLVACTPDLPADWPRGRAFGRTREIRWQQIDGEYFRVDVLTEDSAYTPLGEGWQRTTPEVDGVRDRTVLLWGEMDEQSQEEAEWIEVRIPQVLTYPIEDIEHPGDLQKERSLLRTVIKGYDYTIGGVSVATRWACMEQDKRGVQSAKE